MICQKHFQSPKLLRKSFDIVQPIDAYHELASLELVFECGYPFLNFGLSKGLNEALWLYSDRKGPNVYDPALKCNVSTRRWQTTLVASQPSLSLLVKDHAYRTLEQLLKKWRA